MIRSRAEQSPPPLDEIISSMRAAQSQPQPESLTSVLDNLRRQESITAPFSSNPFSQSVVWPRPDQPGTLIRGHSSTTQTTDTFPFTPSSFTASTIRSTTSPHLRPSMAPTSPIDALIRSGPYFSTTPTTTNPITFSFLSSVSTIQVTTAPRIQSSISRSGPRQQQAPIRMPNPVHNFRRISDLASQSRPITATTSITQPSNAPTTTATNTPTTSTA